MKKTLLLGLGLFWIVVAIFGSSFARNYFRFAGNAVVEPNLLEISRWVLPIGGPRGLADEHTLSVRITFPQEVLADESGLVRVRFDDNLAATGMDRQIAAITAEVGLASPAFEISRPERLSRSGIPPLVYDWVIKPKAMGRHSLIVDLDELLASDSAELLREELTLNGKNLQRAGAESVVLSIRVLTEWGISERTFKALRMLAALLGFVLMYPLWIQWVRRRLGWKE